MNILEFLLALLKIFGTILLFIVLVFIIILLLVLMIPVKYNIEAEKSDKFYADIQATWFLKIIYFRYRISDKGKRTIINIFGRTFYKDKEVFKSEKEKADKYETDKPVEKYDTVKNSSDNYNNETIVQPKVKIEQPIKKSFTQKRKEKKINKEIKKELEKEEEKFGEEVEKYSIIEKIKGILNHPDRKYIEHSSVKLIKRILKAIFPKELKLDIEYGSSDPAKTGYMLAISSILVLYFGNNIKVQGNFQEKVLNGKVKAKGIFTIGYIIWALIVFAISKPIRKIIWKYLKNRKKDK